MEPAFLSVFATLAGSAVGGLTTLAASWLTQRVQFSAQRLEHDIGRRQDLYKDFIEQADRLKNNRLEPLRDFSNACRDEFRMQAVAPRLR